MAALEHAGDLTRGGITATMLRFAAPMMIGNLLQQGYNLADTFIVGRLLGPSALAAVGTSYTLMVFLTSLFIGLSMGSGAVFSLQFGARDGEALRRSQTAALWLIGGVTVAINLLALALIRPVIALLQTPPEVVGPMYDYLLVIFLGMGFTSLYYYYACLLRAVGDSLTPLVYLAVAVVLNIGLDLFCIATLGWGVRGAAVATVAAQAVAGVGLCLHTLHRFPLFRPRRGALRPDRRAIREIFSYSSLTCLQQSVMNFGILMVQGLVNSFGTAVMAAFAVAVKIDSFAYMPAQDFGNAFSTFIAQNYGAGRTDRVRQGVRRAVLAVSLFCLAVSAAVFVWAEPLMRLFVSADAAEIIAVGREYLRVEGSFYIGIGWLFLLYGFFRAVRMPGMSLVLTLFSLGTRVALAYGLAAIPAVGVHGIWWSIPIGWALADAVGYGCYRRRFVRAGR